MSASRKRSRSSTGAAESVSQEVVEVTPRGRKSTQKTASSPKASSPKTQTQEAKPLATSTTTSLDTATVDNLTPPCRGVACLDINTAENHLVVASHGGSLSTFRIFTAKKSHNKKKASDGAKTMPPAQDVFNFFPLVSTGGKRGVTAAKVRFYGDHDEFIVAALHSGQLVQYDAHTLQPIAVAGRIGGSYFDLVSLRLNASSALSLFAACGDGAVRQFMTTSAAAGAEGGAGLQNSELVCTATLCKVAGSDMCLCVTAGMWSETEGIVVAADDQRHIVGQAIGRNSNNKKSRGGAEETSMLRPGEELWVARLPNGVALCIVLDVATASVCVGTSMNEVVFLDAVTGSMERSFSHHKGPVTSLSLCNSTIYASGWHESLRSYRCQLPSSAAARAGATSYAAYFQPADVKRRTHYHECTALHVTSPSTGLTISGAKDGTIMYVNTKRLFTHPAAYFDLTQGHHPYTARGNLVFAFRNNAVEVHKVMDAGSSSHRMLAVAQMKISGDYNIRHLWANKTGELICVATDVRLLVLRLSFAGDTNICTFKAVATIEIAGATAGTFANDNPRELYVVATNAQLFRIVLADKKADPSSTSTLVSPAVSIPSLLTAKASVAANRGGAILDLHFASSESASNSRVLYAIGQSTLYRIPVGEDGINVDAGAKSLNVSAVSSAVVSDGATLVYWNSDDRRLYRVNCDAELAPIVLAEEGVVPPNARPLMLVNAADDSATAESQPKLLMYAPHGLMLLRSPTSWVYVYEREQQQKANAAAENDDDDDDEVAKRTIMQKRKRNAQNAAKDAVAPKAFLSRRLDFAAISQQEEGTQRLFIMNRDVERSLEDLPMMWRVRRFGN